jgi:hypothetical protein
VWGNVRSGVSPPNTRAQDDFPTAAEVASGVFNIKYLSGYFDSSMFIVTTSVRKAKLMDAKEAAENAAADKQARSVEADTFRGVHLDPNAHHWDEVGLFADYSLLSNENTFVGRWKKTTTISWTASLCSETEDSTRSNQPMHQRNQ